MNSYRNSYPCAHEHVVAKLVQVPAVTQLSLETRKRGFAVNYILAYPGMSGIGVPILDQHGRPIASLCVVATIRRMDAKRQALIAQAMWAKSRQIAEMWHSVREVKGPAKNWKVDSAPQHKLKMSA